jgi:hypothetical protein
MLSNLPLQLLSILANVGIIIFVAYYFLELRHREKTIKMKEKKIDGDYHKIVDDALAKERKIIEDATTEADEIIAGTQYATQASKESVDQALRKMVTDVEKEAVETDQDFVKTYQVSLKQAANQSLNDFTHIIKALENDLQKQTKEFRETMLPRMEKELEEYKQMRLKEVDKTITIILQKVSQEILNKSISLDDHQNLLIQALEKAKKEGAFDN